MSQIVKPDRPIWPPVPDPTVPPEPEPQVPPRETMEGDPALHDALRTESDGKAGLSAFEGFGSFSG